MTNRIAKSLATIATFAALAAVGNVPTAQASRGADDPVGHDAKTATVAVAPSAATPATEKAHKVRYRHRHRHGRKAVRRVDDNSGTRRARRADDNRPRGNGADDGPTHR
jgi:hypothetical protein